MKNSLLTVVVYNVVIESQTSNCRCKTSKYWQILYSCVIGYFTGSYWGEEGVGGGGGEGEGGNFQYSPRPHARMLQSSTSIKRMGTSSLVTITAKSSSYPLQEHLLLECCVINHLEEGLLLESQSDFRKGRGSVNMTFAARQLLKSLVQIWQMHYILSTAMSSEQSSK